MTTDPRDPLAGKSRALKAALQAVEDMGAAAANMRTRPKILPGLGKKSQPSRNALPKTDPRQDKDLDIG